MLDNLRSFAIFYEMYTDRKVLNLMSSSCHKERVTTALLLAAGTGSRLYPFTQDAPKCLTMVNGVSILERMVTSLNQHGFKRLVVVTGYMESHIRGFLGNQVGNITIDYVFSPLYKSTNNIYSLWMARKVINEPFLLLESDLVFDDSLLDDMLYPGRIAVAKMQSWMNGTCVTINKFQQVKKFLTDNADSFGETKYKTVNIYSISLTSWRRIVEKLDKRISEGKVNGYYETIFAEMVAEGNLTFKMASFDSKPWYEIDTVEDLARAEKLFSSGNETTTRSVSFSQSYCSNVQLVGAVTSPRKTSGILNVTA